MKMRGYQWTMAICAALFSVAAFATDYTWTGGEDAPRPAAHGDGDTLQYVHPGEAAAVEWLWRRECATTVSTDGNGTVAVSADWVDEDSFVVATATPADGWRFSYWSGDTTDVPVLQNPAKFLANRPRTLVANFVPEDTEVVDNTYTGSKDGSWNTGSNWSLGHIPTAEENAIIPSGKGTVKITNEGRCASLRILSSGALQLLGSGTVAGDQIRLDVRGNAVATGDFTLGNGELSAYNVLFNVGGDLCISNTSKSASFKVYAGDAYGSNVNSVILSGYAGETAAPRIRDYWRGGAQVNVGGKFFLGGRHASNTSTLTLYSHYKTGLSSVFRVGSLEIGARGAVDGYQNGWRSYNAVGLFGLGSARRSGGGASYGGAGGWPTVADGGACGATYGFVNAPYWPGSAGGNSGNDGGHGGSLFRVHARGEVRVDGSVNVNGRDWWSTSARGGGSGGGVWITCESFSAGASAKISAKDMFDKRALLCSMVRLVLVPVITILVTMLLPKAYRSVYMPILLASFTPIGVNISIYAQQYDQDYAYSVVLVCVSTILSIATVPLVYSLADHLI